MINHDGFWAPAPDGPRVGDEDVHVWRIPLDQPKGVVGRLRRVLSEDERERADRFRMELHRDHFTAGRGVLRQILGGYLGVGADALVFRKGTFGKPGLAGAEGESSIRFNLTHSGGLALLAVTSRREVGVDIEQVRPMDDAEQIITRFFSRKEQADFLSLPRGQRTAAFFRGWTRKEAYMKATGEGFALALDRFDVSISPDEPARLLHVEGRPGEPERWSLADLAPGPGFQGALVVEASGWRLTGFQFDADKSLLRLEHETG
ncbi:MAG: 4'-phosphopantetheinyl transferase superfamily protein [Isosphaeraceae bacterium]